MLNDAASRLDAGRRPEPRALATPWDPRDRPRLGPPAPRTARPRRRSPCSRRRRCSGGPSTTGRCSRCPRPESPCVQSALEAAIGQQLVEEHPDGPGRYRWRHALTQEAIYDERRHPAPAGDPFARGRRARGRRDHAARSTSPSTCCGRGASTRPSRSACEAPRRPSGRRLPRGRHAPRARPAPHRRSARARAGGLPDRPRPGAERRAGTGAELPARRGRRARGGWARRSRRPATGSSSAAASGSGPARRRARRSTSAPGTSSPRRGRRPSWRWSTSGWRACTRSSWITSGCLEAARSGVEIAEHAGADFERVYALGFLGARTPRLGRARPRPSRSWTRLRGGARRRATGRSPRTSPGTTSGPASTCCTAASRSGSSASTGLPLVAADDAHRAERAQLRRAWPAATSQAARDGAEQGIRLNERLGYRKMVWRCRVHLAEILLELGRYEEAAAVLRRSRTRTELQDIVYDAAAQIRHQARQRGARRSAVELAREIIEPDDGSRSIAEPLALARRGLRRRRRPRLGRRPRLERATREPGGRRRGLRPRDRGPRPPRRAASRGRGCRAAARGGRRDRANRRLPAGPLRVRVAPGRGAGRGRGARRRRPPSCAPSSTEAERREAAADRRPGARGRRARSGSRCRRSSGRPTTPARSPTSCPRASGSSPPCSPTSAATRI